MRLTASFALLAFAGSVIGCSSAPGPTTAGDPNAPLCAFSGLTPASSEWPGCLTSMAVNPDRDLLVAVIKARQDAEASGAPDVGAEFQKRAAPADAETYRRMISRREQAARTGTADCGAWHWNGEKAACRP
jgi:hypothetical protein